MASWLLNTPQKTFAALREAKFGGPGSAKLIRGYGWMATISMQAMPLLPLAVAVWE